jgi:hypothetical protein
MKCKLTWPETTFTVLEIAYGFDEYYNQKRITCEIVLTIVLYEIY